MSFVVGAGVHQLLDLGAGIPTAGNVHEVAQALDPSTRVVYVDIDPIASALSQQILAGTPNAIAIEADVMKPDELLADSNLRNILDFSQPAAVLLVAFLHFVATDEEAHRLIRSLRDALAPGSYFAVSHATGVFNPQRAAQTQTVYNRATSPVTLRSREQIAAFFEGFELVAPGLVPTPAWRPDSLDATFASEPHRGQAFAAVGRKL